MTLPVTVDPRYHDAVIFNLDAVVTDTDGVPVFESTIKLVRKLRDVGVATAVYSVRPGGQQLLKSAGIDDLFGVCVDGIPAAALVEVTRQLGVRPQRSVVVDDAGAGIAAARDGGFALVIGVDARECRPTTERVAPTSWLRTWRTSLCARATGGSRSSPMRWIHTVR